jgi:peptidoglycan-associated lipoprotein
VGCGRKDPPAELAPAPEVRADAPVTEDRAAAERATREEAEARRREADRIRATLEAKVFFAYDQAEVDAEARRILDEKVRVLVNTRGIRLRIEGHADERGSTEYNLALAARRASSVATYMSGFGVEDGRLETRSFGEERPAVPGRDERAWSQNRRAEFVITAGAPTASAPSVPNPAWIARDRE